LTRKLNLDDLIGRTYKFDEINEGFRLLVSHLIRSQVISSFEFGDLRMSRSPTNLYLRSKSPESPGWHHRQQHREQAPLHANPATAVHLEMSHLGPLALWGAAVVGSWTGAPMIRQRACQKRSEYRSPVSQ
jgi:hypothetical protein